MLYELLRSSAVKASRPEVLYSCRGCLPNPNGIFCVFLQMLLGVTKYWLVSLKNLRRTITTICIYLSRRLSVQTKKLTHIYHIMATTAIQK